jgi:poly-gamma-glutamate synthesis protein (capsule biosynthesis protein)
MTSTVRLLIAGDLCPINRYVPLFRDGGRGAILGPFEDRAGRADLFVANLECPLIGRPSPIEKTGPALGAPAECARGLREIGLTAVGLANNHILDHGEPGLASTLEALAGCGVAGFGAGPDLGRARTPLVREVRGRRIGFLAMAEREWSIAGPAAPGANPLDIIDFVRQMKEWRGSLDFLAVLLHGGAEGCPLPSPGLRKVCRFLVEQGADLVTCQHSHCIGAHEVVDGRLILYGQGNFIFDYPAGYHDRDGLLIDLELLPDGGSRFELVPFTQAADRAGLAALDPEAEARCRAAMAEGRRQLEEGELEARWEAFCLARALPVLDEVLDHGRILRRLNRGGALLRWHGRPYLKNLKSVVQNESHLEVLNTALRSMLR